MKFMNALESAAPVGGALRAVALGTGSFGAFPNGRAHTSI